MLEFFGSVIDHGQEFDDRSRWCVICECTVQTQSDSSTFSDKKCSTCSALWPEYVEEFLEGFEDDPMYQVIYGIGETVH